LGRSWNDYINLPRLKIAENKIVYKNNFHLILFLFTKFSLSLKNLTKFVVKKIKKIIAKIKGKNSTTDIIIISDEEYEGK
jgi:hypothetical protein